jgi:cell wall-associated NlpC family hydrolase
MKWLIGIVSTLMITGCVSPTPEAYADTQFVFAEDVKPQVVDTTTAFHITSGEKNTNSTLNIKAGVVSPEKLAEKQLLLQVQLTNATNIRKTVGALKKRVGRTSYVFSGSTPSGWDCSGLVMWAYQRMGVELEHRASLQKKAGILVKDPKVGDIVAFTYKNSKTAYHVGIYIGSGKMIHARREGHGTVIEEVTTFAGKYSKVTYTRILDTP